MTSSLDYSIRLWDIESKLVGVDSQLMSMDVIKTKDSKGKNTVPNSITFSPSGNLIAAGCNDGSL